MVMPVTLRRFTVAEIDALPDDGNRYEVLDGVLFVTPGPGLPHQTVAQRLTVALSVFLAGRPDVGVWSPGVVPIDDASRLEPDVLVGVLPPRWEDWTDVQDRWLAIEVSGRGSRLYDRTYKRDAYLASGVREVWLVDLLRHQVSVSRLDGAPELVCQGSVEWREPGTGRPLRVDLGAVFRGVVGGD